MLYIHVHCMCTALEYVCYTYMYIVCVLHWSMCAIHTCTLYVYCIGVCVLYIHVHCMCTALEYVCYTYMYAQY